MNVKTLLSVVAMLSLLAIKANSEVREFDIEFSESDFTFISKEDGSISIKYSGLCIYPDSPNPAIPLIKNEFVIPGGLKYESMDYTVTKRLVRTGVSMAQAPQVVPTNQLAIETGKDYHTYTGSAYPTEICRMTMESNWAELTEMYFVSCPFVYDSTDGNLYFVDNIHLNITVSNIESGSNNVGLERCPDYILDKYGISKDNEVGKNSKSVAESTSTRIDYVIITKEALRESFMPLVRWKRKKGIYADIVTVEEIKNKYANPDYSEPLKIKLCLYDLHHNNGLKYVLLGGDESIVPSFKCYGKVVDKITKEDNTIPTDMFYACLSRNDNSGGHKNERSDRFGWNSNENEYSGEPEDSINFNQNVYVARIPVLNENDSRSFVKKIMGYETSTEWDGKILMGGCNLGSNNQGITSDAEIMGDTIYKHISDLWKGKRYKFYDTNTDFPGGKSFDFTKDNLKDLIANGYSFIDIITHGVEDGWIMESKDNYDSSVASAQSNKGYSIITTIACLTNAFDRSDPDPCLSESLIRNPDSGVVAYWGCSREGWAALESDLSIGASGLFVEAFYKNLFTLKDEERNFGKIASLAKNEMLPFCATHGPYRWVLFGVNPIGDPEMPIYIEHPMEFTDAHISRRSFGNYHIETGIDSCRLCLMSLKDFGETYYNIYDNLNSLDIKSKGVDCVLTMTKPGYIPLSYEIQRLFHGTGTSDLTVSSDVVEVGSFDSSDPSDKYVIDQGKTIIRAKTVVLGPGTEVKKGASLVVTPFRF